jgi:hypothetical protein
MTDMSPAALPPRQPPIRAKDREHPLFPAYMQHRNGMANKLVEALSFDGFVYQHNREQAEVPFLQHPRRAEFVAWCRQTQSGRRKCCPTKGNPNGLIWPANFQYWLDGGRW